MGNVLNVIIAVSCVISIIGALVFCACYLATWLFLRAEWKRLKEAKREQ